MALFVNQQVGPDQIQQTRVPVEPPTDPCFDRAGTSNQVRPDAGVDDIGCC